MHKTIAGLAAIIVVAFTGPALAESETEEIQETEQPGSEFELDVDSDGQVEFGRKSKVDAEEAGAPEGKRESNPLEIGGGDPLGDDPLDDPDLPDSPDAIDDELPGEGPESLSGPDDDDPLPY
jgi:hypothetical protein